MQDTLLKQEQTFLWYRECICLSRITLHCAVTELHSVHLSMPHFPVLKKRCILQTLHPFSEKTMRFEQQGAVPWKICCSLSSPVSLALSYSCSHCFFFSFLSVAKCTCGCLCKISGESIRVPQSIGPGSITAWPKRRAPFPELFPSSLVVLNLAVV